MASLIPIGMIQGIPGPQGPVGPQGPTGSIYIEPSGDETGVTDRANIQAAIDAIGEAGIVRFHPEGVYTIDQSIRLKTGVILAGEGSTHGVASVIKPASGFKGILIATPEDGSRVQQCAIRGICFDGSDTALTAISVNAQETVIEDCTFRAFWTYGVTITGGASAKLCLNNVIRNNAFYPGNSAKFYNAILEDYYSADTKVTDNYIEGCTSSAIKLSGNNSHVSRNHIYACGCGIETRDSCEKRFMDNYIENIDECAVRCVSGSAEQGTLQLISAGNFFRNINRSGNAQGLYQFNGSAIKEVLISNQVFKADPGTGYTVANLIYYEGYDDPASIFQFKTETTVYDEDLVTDDIYGW